MRSHVPKFVSTVLMGDDPHLLGELSTLLGRKRAYLPVLDGPRIHRPDFDAEVIRRNNAVARTQPQHIILAGLPDSTCELFSRHFPSHQTRKIASADQLAEFAGRARSSNPLWWGRDKVGLGVLRALRGKQRIAFHDAESPGEGVALDSTHIVVCEEGNDHAQVVAANYAHAVGAGLCLIPLFPVEEAETLLDALYACHENRSVSATAFLKDFKGRLRSHVGALPLDRCAMLTFVTARLPWGVAFPEVPSTHLFCYPDFGISLVNAIASEQPDSPGIRVAAVIDPGAVDSTEIQTALVRLTNSGVFSKALRARAATVYQVANTVALFPYDLLLISTHCGDVPGWRWTYEFVDTEGLPRTLVVDIAIGVQIVPGHDDLRVSQFIKFVSLDGVDWNDREAKKALYVGKAIIDYTQRISDKSLDPISREKIPRVMGSMALRMADGNYIPLPEPINPGSLPIVMNNACGSWHRLAGNFMFANARCYLGTLFSVVDAEAQQMVEKLFGKYFGTELAVGIWRIQREMYGDGVRRPYVLVGCHFQRLRTSGLDGLDYALEELKCASIDWKSRLRHLDKADPKAKSAARIVEFIDADLTSLREWQGKGNVPMSKGASGSTKRQTSRR